MLRIALPSALVLLLLVALRAAASLGAGAWKVERRRFTVAATTAAFNGAARRQLALGGRAGHRVLSLIFDAGAVACAAGSVAAVGGVLWGLLWLALASHLPQVVPPIPGITAPLSDLPTAFLSALVIQLVHEWGHQLCAALDDLSPSQLSIKVHLVVPSVHTSFPPDALAALPPRSRARIAAGGPLHTLLVVLFLCALPSLEAPGREILAVANHSGLDRYLVPGDKVTHINDWAVGNRPWIRVIEHQDEEDDRGWCIAAERFEAAPETLTPETPQCSDPQLAVFERVGHSQALMHCLSPHEIVNSPITECRCAPETPVCVRPLASERITRLRYLRGKHSRVFVWRGHRMLLQALTVEEPRGEATEWVAVLLSYSRLVAVATLLLSLLPVRRLDGDRLLDALLAAVSARTVREGATVAGDGADAAERGVEPVAGAAPPWVARGQRGLEYVLAATLGLALVKQGVLGIARASG